MSQSLWDFVRFWDAIRDITFFYTRVTGKIG